MKQKIVLILAGYSCAGKSTTSRLLAERFGLALMDQYEIYSALAREQGYERTREWLAAIGNEAFVRVVTQETARRIGADTESAGAVVDVSYGPVMHTIFKALLPNVRFVTIAIQTRREMRVVRMANRAQMSPERAEDELTFRDDFLATVNLEKVLREAEYTVRNEGDLESTISKIEALLQPIIAN